MAKGAAQKGLSEGHNRETVSEADLGEANRVTDPKPPTIFLTCEGADWPKHAAKIQSRGLEEELEATHRGSFFRLKTATVGDFRTVQRYLTDEHLPFHTFNFRGGGHRCLKVVISGLPAVTEDQLAEELDLLQFDFRQVCRLRTFRGPTRSWLVTLTPDSEREEGTKPAANIYLVAKLFAVRVKVSAYRRPDGPAQCHRCQGFGHGSVNCYRPKQCVRCGGDHHRAACTKAVGEKGKCCNCGEQHNASYRGCKAWKKEQRTWRQLRRAPTKRTWLSSPEPSPERPAVEDQEEATADVDEEGWTAKRRKKKRLPRNPANRDRPTRAGGEPQKKEEARFQPPAPLQRQTPRRRIDWPPQSTNKETEGSPATEVAPASATPNQPQKDAVTTGSSAPTTSQEAVQALLAQLTALVGQLAQLTAALLHGRL